MRAQFASPGSLETTRAFVLGGVLLAVLVGIGAQLFFRELSLKVLTERLDLGHDAAYRIARAVERVGADGSGGVDFSRVRRSQELLRQFIQSRIQNQTFIDHVEVYDRFGVRQLLVIRERGPGEPLAPRDPAAFIPEDWPAAGSDVVRHGLNGLQGEVRLTVNKQPILRELAGLQDSLRRKALVAAIGAGLVLVAGFVYVLSLLRRNRLLEQSRQSAERASYMGLLASGLAHEIRNPLNAMNMNLQMLEEEMQAVPEADADHLELLESTKSEIKRLERLVNNFLAYARPAPPRFEPRDIDRVVQEVVRLLENDFRQSGVRLESRTSGVLPNVEIDDAQFKQALINLLVNARQVLREGGTVAVATRPGPGGEIVLEVSDDGPGIPPEAQERIFEVFYSSRGGGTGLGLPIAKQVVERHGGTIQLESRVGEGTTFRIRLPRTHAAPRADREGDEAQGGSH